MYINSFGSNFNLDYPQLFLPQLSMPQLPIFSFNTVKNPSENSNFEEFVQKAYAGIPDRTSTIEDKQKAILAKVSILNHPNCPEETKAVLQQEIATINNEINQIKKNINIKV